ncbi:MULTISPECIES: DUF6634 family protein [Methylobacterium]|uniref:DUF6634 family protein n=1 Tax=Methylobacterium TaxID=407 RepID=UPI0027E5272F|nr:DUF6634 family protein [Methylobacterium hispanicum]
MSPARPARRRRSRVLSGWQRGTVPAREPVLVGRVEGHPCLPGRRTIATSRLLALDPVLGWARTSSRWYRLGPERDLSDLIRLERGLPTAWSRPPHRGLRRSIGRRGARNAAERVGRPRDDGRERAKSGPVRRSSRGGC